MKVWGIDPSSKCGLAIWDTKEHVSKMHCEVIENKVKRDYYWYAVQMGRKLHDRVQRFGKPDLVVIEQGSESTQGTGIEGVIWGWNCAGAIASMMGVFGMPIATITPAGWRKPFYGLDFLPPQIPVMEGGKQVIKNGKPQFKNDWKTAAIQKCDREGILIPTQKTISHNAAEAAGIAHSWAHSSIINKEYERAFTVLKQQRNDRSVSDLFGEQAA